MCPDRGRSNRNLFDVWDKRANRAIWLDVVHSLSSGKCILTCSNHYSIIQSSFTALKVLCAPCTHPSPPPTPDTTDFFTATIILSFTECHIFEIIQYDSFTQLLSLNNRNLSFFHIFSWLHSSFSLALNNTPLHGCTTVYLPMCQFLCTHTFSVHSGKYQRM